MAGIEYVVLRHDGNKWDNVLVVTAPSADAAKRRAAEARAAETSHEDGGDGTYVAVPSRSWDPTEIEIEVPKPKAVIRARVSG